MVMRGFRLVITYFLIFSFLSSKVLSEECNGVMVDLSLHMGLPKEAFFYKRTRGLGRMRDLSPELRGLLKDLGELHQFGNSRNKYRGIHDCLDNPIVCTPDEYSSHRTSSVISPDTLYNSGNRIIVNVAWADEHLLRPTLKAKKNSIIRQLEVAEDLVKKYPELFVIATSPQEARGILNNPSDKRVIIIQGIEGTSAAIRNVDDIDFWKKEHQVSFVTLSHFNDTKYFPGSYNDGDGSILLNILGRKTKKLTDESFQMIKKIADAGILIDLTHLDADVRGEMLSFMREEGIPPIVSHIRIKAMREERHRGYSAEDICQVYLAGGMIGIALGGQNLEPIGIFQKMKEDSRFVPFENISEYIEIPKDYCPGTQDAFFIASNYVQKVLQDCSSRIFPNKENLGPIELERLAFSFGSDFDGLSDHGQSKLTLCPDKLKGVKDLNIFDHEGLRDPSMLPFMFERHKKSGGDLCPFKRSGERFLQIWEELYRRNSSSSPEGHVSGGNPQ